MRLSLRAGIRLASVLAIVFSSRVAAQTSPGAEVADRRPNIVLILTDDQGYGDLGIAGNPVLKTPNIDRLAGQGVMFRNFYMAPICAPAQAGESDREALARLLTADMQFSRAIVNYIWKEFFSRGIVEPPDQFDPLRLDSENPPPTPWRIQPSHPELLDLLAQGFVDSGFDLKWLMREITNSRAYEFSSRYEGAWSPSYEPFFARHQVRRLTAEQLHDAMVTSSGLPIPYLVSPTIRFVPLAMQFPDVQFVPLGERRRGDEMGDAFAAAATRFLDAFLRGNREETPRSGEGSILQALELMNGALVVDRVSAGNTGGTMALLLQQPDDVLVQGLYLAVLGRLPSTDELALGVATLADGDRVENAEDLMWSLFNALEFIFNH